MLALLAAGTNDKPEFEGTVGTPGVSSKVNACIGVYPLASAQIATGLWPEGQATPDAIAAASPTTYIGPSFAPTIFIHGEARTVGGNLEQDAVGLADVQAPEPEAIHPAAVRYAELVQPLRPGVVVRIGRAEGDVMHASSALPRHLQVRLDGDVQLRMRPSGAHLEDVHARARIVGMRAVAR